ncbi:MAG: RluA family pseudouridine synthase [Chloroflexi bacterium]|nr:RluA family pseudouridine synthase [Chloroflexota bacterium]
MKIPVLHADETILVVNKPAGLPTLPDGYDTERLYLVTALEPEHGTLWVVHRLDRETSGVIVLARNQEAHKSLNTQFEQRDVSKVYHALVSGNPMWDERTISAPLRADSDNHHRTVIDNDMGKPATTAFRVLERFGRGAVRYALVEAQPETGRTHQIRVHLAALGAPVAVDLLYGKAAPILLSEIKRQYRGEVETERPLLDRLGLHALRLSIRHPLTGEQMQFEAPYPKDFGATLNQLRKHFKV